MSRTPKPLIVIGSVFSTIGSILLFPVLLAAALVFLIVTLPYTLFYFSSNFSLTGRDFQIVEAYLRHFERLHPDLIAYVAQAHESMGRGEPPGLSFWPRKSTHTFLAFPGISGSSSQWKFSHGAGFFARLEAAGFPRRAVWEFLRDQVEPSGLVNELQKLDFNKLMDKMTSHKLITYNRGPTKPSNDPRKEQERQEKDELQEKKATELYSHLGRPIVRVRRGSLDFILRRGALLVPDSETRPIMTKLVNFPPVWANAEKMSADEEGGQGDHWQIADARILWPWHDDY